MKKIITAIALAVSLSASQFVYAIDEFAYLENDHGGKIVFTMNECPKFKNKPIGFVYSTNEKGVITYEGCWIKGNLGVIVEWNNGVRAVYNPAEFTFIPGVLDNEPKKQTKTYHY